MRTVALPGGRLQVGASAIEVARRPDGRIALAVYEQCQERNEAFAGFEVSVGQALTRSLRLAVRLAAITDPRPGTCPPWCDPRYHLADRLLHSTDVGEFPLSGRTVDVTLHQPPGGTVTVGFFLSMEWGPDALVDLTPTEAAELARLFDVASGVS